MTLRPLAQRPDPSVLPDIEYMLARTPEQRLSDLSVSDALVKTARRVS